MNAFQIKVHLFKNGLTVTKIAEGLQPTYGGSTESIRKMLTNLFYHGVWNERLAATVKSEYGIVVHKPKQSQTVREAVQRAA